VIPLTRASVKHLLHVEMTASECGLKEDSTALVDHLKFVDRERLSDTAIGRAGAGALARIDRSLVRVLGLNAGPGFE